MARVKNVKKKILFFDVDGTLLTMKDGEQYVPPSAIAAMAEARARGCRSYLCTGRSLAEARSVGDLPVDGIIGAAGLFLGFAQMNNIDAFCLMGETSGFFVDHGSSIRILEVLGKMFSVEDLSLAELQEKSQQLDVLTEKVNTQEPDNGNDLSHIG